MTNKTRTTLLISFVLVLVLGASAVFLWQGHPGQETETIRIGYTPVTGNLALFVAVEQGLFENADLDVQIQDFQNANLHTQALLAGQIDGSATIPITSALLVERQQPHAIKLLAVNIYPRTPAADAIIVRQGAPINTIADLKGKRIGIIPDVSALSFVRAMVEPELDPDTDVEITQIPVPNQLDALASDNVDALWALEPLVTIAVEKGIGTVLEEGAMAKHIHEPMVTAAFTLSNEFVTRQPELAQAYKDAILAAADWIEENPEEARLVLPKYTSIEASLAPKVRLVEYADVHDTVDDIRFLAQWLLEREIIEEVPDINPMLF